MASKPKDKVEANTPALESMEAEDALRLATTRRDAIVKEIKLQQEADTVSGKGIDALSAKIFAMLLEHFLKVGGRCSPQGYTDVTPESIVIITNQAAVIAEAHFDAMAKWRERQENPPKRNPDEGQVRFA